MGHQRSLRQPGFEDFSHLGNDDIFPVWASSLREALTHALERMKRTRRPTVLVKSVVDTLPDEETCQKLRASHIPLVNVANTHTGRSEVSAALLDDTMLALRYRALGLQRLYVETSPMDEDDARPCMGEACRHEEMADAGDEQKQKFLDAFYANASRDDGAR